MSVYTVIFTPSNYIFRLLLTFNATSLLVIIFLVQQGHVLTYFFPILCPYFEGIPNYASYLAYLLIPITLTWLSILLCPLLGKDEFETGDIVSIEHANNIFLPSYLAYFFVALSIGNWETLFFVYGVLFLFTFLSQALYFNPLFLLFRFEFYNIVTKDGAAVFLISRSKYKLPKDVNVETAYRINDYTFLETV